MVRKDVEEYLKILLAQIDTKGADARKLINVAITIGEDYFFKAHDWSFKENSTTITTSANNEMVDLPDDFSAILSLRERDSANGRKIHPLRASQYDEEIPYSADLSTGKPKYYKLYFNADDGIYKLALYPTPDATYTLYLNYHINGLGIPTDFFDPYIASICPYIYPHGSQQRIAALQERNATISKHILRDNPDASIPHKMYDAEETAIAGTLRPWDDGWDWSGN